MKSIVWLLLIALSCGACNSGNSQPEQFSSSSTDMLAALDSFESYLNERWSYRFATDVGYASPINELREKIKKGISNDEFGIEIEKIIALGIDGHSRVRGYTWPQGGCLPFLIEVERDHFIATNSDRNAFLVKIFLS